MSLQIPYLPHGYFRQCLKRSLKKGIDCLAELKKGKKETGFLYTSVHDDYYYAYLITITSVKFKLSSNPTHIHVVMFCNSSSKYNILLTIQTSKETKNPQTRVSTNLSWCPVCHLSGSGDNRDTPKAHFADTRGKKSVKKRDRKSVV